MYTRSPLTAFTTVILMSLMTAASASALPSDRIVKYVIRDDPSDPGSDVVLNVALTLHPSDSDAGSIGWEITEIELRAPGSGGGADTVWVESAPDVDTADGLWWVDHSNTNTPQLSEFTVPPRLAGTASAEDPADADLDYDFRGRSYTPPANGAPYDPTAALDYSFTADGETAPIAEGEEEPTELQEDDDPSGTT